MEFKKNAKDMIQRHEGLRLKPYRCTAGKLTIGYGRNLDDRGISLAEAEALFDRDLDQVDRELSQHIEFYPSLSSKGKIILLDMAFNMGIRGLLGFRRMLIAMKEQDYERAALEMEDSLWAKQVPHRSEELCEMMKSLKSEPPTLAQLYEEVKSLRHELGKELKK